jgi:hypothetical protein
MATKLPFQFRERTGRLQAKFSEVLSGAVMWTTIEALILTQALS